MINYIDLFSGIGGFAYGAYLAGMKFENHFFSEIDKYCIELYKKRFPESIFLGDINKIDFEKLKKDYLGDWIITGGFPCQDISIAGKGAGIEGSRSGLWFEMWRAIRILRPRFAIIENVGAITFRGLDRVISSLAEIGYNAEWQDIRAEDVGAPHKRERIWIVAYPAESGLSQSQKSEQQKSLLYAKRGSSEVSDSLKQHDDNPGYGTGKICRKRQEETEIQGSFSNPSIKRLEREKPEGQQPGKQGLFTECNNELSDSDSNNKHGRCGTLQMGRVQVQGKIKEGIIKTGNQWSFEPDVGRLAHGVSHRVDRLKGLGNAIVPQIAMILFLQIKEYIYEY